MTIKRDGSAVLSFCARDHIRRSCSAASNTYGSITHPALATPAIAHDPAGEWMRPFIRPADMPSIDVTR